MHFYAHHVLPCCIAETLGLAYESLQVSIPIFVLWLYSIRVIFSIQYTFISAKYLIDTNTRLNIDPTLWAQQFFESAVHLHKKIYHMRSSHHETTMKLQCTIGPVRPLPLWCPITTMWKGLLIGNSAWMFADVFDVKKHWKWTNVHWKGTKFR